MVIWTCSTGAAGAATTRTLAAAEATEAVLAHWGRRHPGSGGAEGVTIRIEATEATEAIEAIEATEATEATEAHVGPARDEDGGFDAVGTATMMDLARDHLAHDHDHGHVAQAGDEPTPDVGTGAR